ncbi:hypothetical protein ENUP19_0256G0016 [Entamoeba nuttalli]|uniref:PCI domain containing protein n=2 Tax=Entamoeba nuttalli TaxID=412467 RepID=K2HJ24_ENTNP|nr:PCI domain containing protein [Entamoeba nuttalli P19]EKE43014.1 PCI domain containing protein [Entamoeba nuttalli P19]|eukprot:XP_008854651.1 PCI domain containing protein [Entamoeba nuttalli P19]
MFDDDDMMFDDEGEVIDDEEIGIENKFYDAKNEMETNLEGAIESFKEIVQEDSEKKTEWGYKSLRKLCRYYGKANNEEEFKTYFVQFLEYLNIPAVSKAEKGLFLIVGDINGMRNEVVTEVVNKAIEICEKNSNFSRIIFKLNIKKANTMFESGKYEELKPFLSELVNSCYLPNGKEDPMRSHLLIELYGLEIQLYSKLNDMRKLQQLCGKINFSDRNISHPKVLGIIMECCGKVKLCNSDFAGAKNDFFDSFKSLDEAGLPERFDALRFTILAHLLSASKIDIFQAQEVKSYQTSPEMELVYQLYCAFNENNIIHFKEALNKSGSQFKDHPYIQQYIPLLIETAQKNLILKLVKCFKRIKFSFLAQELDMQEEKVELLVLRMIFDNTLKAKINQFDRYLIMTEEQSSVTRKYIAITSMSKTLAASISV